ncbi:MAG: imidazoleglycerol-phosphate dehydratase, partial [Akkermansiaceae bacterium]|nr:imidazoleglycerol-phosphate dehydratase [Akkermansiaceae bacterium]
SVRGDVEVDYHHTVEDSGIVLGECMREALGDKCGITRYGHAYVPMDEALARVVVDLSNRPWLEFRAPGDTPDAQNFPFSLVEEFLRALSSNLRANLHVEVFYGRDGHHIAESVFKALARALRVAVSRDPRVTGVPSTKEVL